MQGAGTSYFPTIHCVTFCLMLPRQEGIAAMSCVSISALIMAGNLYVFLEPRGRVFVINPTSTAVFSPLLPCSLFPWTSPSFQFTQNGEYPSSNRGLVG
jgi:hypothetical protein